MLRAAIRVQKCYLTRGNSERGKSDDGQPRLSRTAAAVTEHAARRCTQEIREPRRHETLVIVEILYLAIDQSDYACGSGERRFISISAKSNASVLADTALFERIVKKKSDDHSAQDSIENH